IVGTILFLVGAISALQSADTLKSFGASIFVVDMLALGMAREMAPLMTAIIISGRSGSAIASEIATMKFTEELDAIKTMGLNPIRFIVVPKLWAMVVCLPLLSIMALGFGILGGFIVGITYIDLSPGTFINRLVVTLFFRDIITGLLKSVSYAVIITFVGTFRGLNFTGGADGVGRATTMSVVTAIFAIIFADAIWSIILYF
ncbi:MAG: ABC transporter permease, partial [Candidatus Latescibacteria bacterium]|nr:ABC transporter permease [Candidatus Latescibacterota bacterium]